MNESEERVREAADDPYGDKAVVVAADLRELLRLLDEARADLARVTAERDAPAAKLARCERLLLNVRDHGINAPMEQTIDDYFAEQEPTDSPPFCQRHDCPLPCPACSEQEPRT